MSRQGLWWRLLRCGLAAAAGAVWTAWYFARSCVGWVLGFLGCVAAGAPVLRSVACRVALPVDEAVRARVWGGGHRSATVVRAGPTVCAGVLCTCIDRTAGSPVTAAYRSGFGCGLVYWGARGFPAPQQRQWM